MSETTHDAPLPSEGCFVRHRSPERHEQEIGVVEKIRDTQVLVRWGSSGITELHGAAELGSGFREGHVVQDRPRSNVRNTLGTGTVVGSRNVAGRDMVLVQSHATGESRWLPFERLVRLRDAALKYERTETSHPDDAERFRLRALAFALDSWNQITGALDRLDVDPLPHQIDIVHRIMTSDRANWLIADDVGLGKTIEVGLLLAALKRRHLVRRVLVICPAAVVRQWQDEMQFKFNEDFRIYGMDFNVNQPAHWRSHDKVIVSIDRAKADMHSQRFGNSGDWDVVIFDEAHHLSKIEGAAVTQRYKLAELMQPLTDCFIFLTGTPHQGNTMQFVNLLLLLRPDLKSRLARIHTDPTVVAELVLRNRKSQATDASGNFIFRGQDTRLVYVPTSSAAKEFDEQLKQYVKNGYAASAIGGTTSRAIGFVMTTYRKLASSSIAAIDTALRRRYERLVGYAQDLSDGNSEVFEEMQDAFAEGLDGRDDLGEIVARSKLGRRHHPFFSGELELLSALQDAAQAVRRNDLKLKTFLTEVVSPIHERGLKLLIFTEYRATQDYVVEALQCTFDEPVCEINGSMDLTEKERNIDAFNESVPFLVSTEAGGEGINLHRNCHVLVNYDLPWNPRRLVQRAGRLYRYGQKERVIVFNLMARDGFDSRALAMLLERVSNIAHSMAEVDDGFDSGIETEIVGELLERVDVAEVLSRNEDMQIERSESDVEDAIRRAKEAREMQRSLFSQIEGFSADSGPPMYAFEPDDIMSFLAGVLPRRGIVLRTTTHDGRVLEIELPSELRGKYSEFGERSVVRITAHRMLAERRGSIVQMDFASEFFQSLVTFAKTPEFSGEFATIRGPSAGTIALYKLRWQNDQGLPRWEELVSIYLPLSSDTVAANPGFFGSMLTQGQATIPLPTLEAGQAERSQILSKMRARAEEELAAKCTALRHPNDVVLLAAADIRD